MTYILRLILIGFCALIVCTKGADAARTQSIVAVVNEEVITSGDLESRIDLMILSAGLPDSNDIRDRMQDQILSTLIDEHLMRQEAARLELDVTDEEIEQGLARLAAQNNVPTDRFLRALEQRGIDISTMRQQIKAQLAWSKVVQSRVRPRINITETDVEALKNRLMQATGKSQYLLSEIFLPVSEAEEESRVRQLANKLVSELRQKRAPFARVANQFSQSASAARGGDLGWLEESQIDDALASAVTRLNKGGISEPVKSPAGYHILLLRDKKIMDGDDIPATQALRNQIGMERLERGQRSYLLDLRSAAFIDERL